MTAPAMPTVRRATPADYAQLAEVMFEAVRHGPSRYSEAQRIAWMPERRGGPAWTARLDRQFIAVAEDATGVLGFMSLDDGGYIDFAHIRPRAQGTGLFRRLFAHIEQASRARGDARMWVHASLAAQPAFSALGFAVLERERVPIGAETLERFVMERRASP